MLYMKQPSERSSDRGSRASEGTAQKREVQTVNGKLVDVVASGMQVAQQSEVQTVIGNVVSTWGNTS